MILKISHRGYIHKSENVTINENSMESIQNAINNEFNMVEIDVQLTKDKQIILYHDNIIKYEDKLLIINEMTYSDICNLKKIVLLKDVLSNFKNSFYLDLKGNVEISTYLIDLFNKNKIQTDNLWIGSFNLEHIKVLSKFKNKFNYKLGIITYNYFADLKFKDLNIDFMSINYSLLPVFNNSLIKDLKIFVYTIKDTIEIDFCKNFKIDGLISDIKIIN